MHFSLICISIMFGSLFNETNLCSSFQTEAMARAAGEYMAYTFLQVPLIHPVLTSLMFSFSFLLVHVKLFTHSSQGRMDCNPEYLMNRFNQYAQY